MERREGKRKKIRRKILNKKMKIKSHFPNASPHPFCRISNTWNNWIQRKTLMTWAAFSFSRDQEAPTGPFMTFQVGNKHLPFPGHPPPSTLNASCPQGKRFSTFKMPPTLHFVSHEGCLWLKISEAKYRVSYIHTVKREDESSYES